MQGSEGIKFPSKRLLVRIWRHERTSECLKW